MIRWLAARSALLALALGVAGPMAADPVARGKTIYQRCIGCHSLERNRTGPKHCGVVGRRAGSVEGFPYSPALRGSGIVWTREQLDRFLAAPLKAVPGTRMGYAGVPDAQERSDLIAYLTWASASAPECTSDASTGGALAPRR